jgi:[ribosomal protein S5]-alanine N-acetyltransferase
MLLKTPRLRLEPLAQRHSTELLAYYLRNAAHLRDWEPARPAGYFTPATFELSVASWVRSCEVQAAARWLIFANDGGELCMGTVNLSGIAGPPFQACSLGYGLDSAAQGHGYMKEALKAVIAHAFGPMRLHRIMANHLPHNQRSAATLAALGFEREGYAKNYLQIAGSWQDHVLTALTNDQQAPLGI